MPTACRRGLCFLRRSAAGTWLAWWSTGMAIVRTLALGGRSDGRKRTVGGSGRDSDRVVLRRLGCDGAVDNDSARASAITPSSDNVSNGVIPATAASNDSLTP